MMPDAQLEAALAAVRNGDTDRYREIVEQCQDGVRRFLAARCRRISEVEELVQATFVTAYQSIDQWTGEGVFQAWLIGIAKNHLRHHQRSWLRDRSTGIEAIDSFAAPETHEASSADEDAIVRMRRCIGQLPERSRRLLQQRYADGLPLAQLAQRFSTATEVLATRLLRLRQALRQCIEAQP